MTSAKKKEDKALNFSTTQGETSDDDACKTTRKKISTVHDKPSDTSYEMQSSTASIESEPVSPILTMTTGNNSIQEQVPNFHQILLNIQEKQEKILKMFEEISNFNEGVQKSFEDVYTEILTIKKNVIREKQIHSIPVKRIFPHFPIKNMNEMTSLETKLRDQIYFEKIRSSITEHVPNFHPEISTIREFYRTMLQMMLDEHFVKDVSWKSFPNKTSFGSTKLAELIQCMYTVNLIFFYLIIYCCYYISSVCN